MRARGSGHIVNISSMTGLVANPPNAYYSSTKFALEAVTEALATEVRPLGGNDAKKMLRLRVIGECLEDFTIDRFRRGGIAVLVQR